MGKLFPQEVQYAIIVEGKEEGCSKKMDILIKILAKASLTLSKIYKFASDNWKIILVLLILILFIIWIRGELNFCGNPFLNFLCKR